MKTVSIGKKLSIEFESDRESADFERWLIQAWQLMPNLMYLIKLVDEEPSILTESEFREKQRAEGLWVMPSLKTILDIGVGHIALTTDKKLVAMRRDTDGNQMQLDASRVILSGLKLFCFIPYDEVLEQEKAWRTKKYMAEVRDKCVVSAVEEAKYRAVRNADMCVFRAKKLVQAFFKKHPEFAFEWAMLYNVARQWERATGTRTNLIRAE